MPSEGWGVLHLFFRADSVVDAGAVVAALKECEADEHAVVPFAILGHKADFGVMALGPDFWRLQELQADLVGAELELVDSYLSMTEVSEYAKGMPAELLEPRLHPQLPPPDATVLCFYPMSKRREGEANWYSLPYEEREKLMHGHGKKARDFKGRVLQLVTASTGLDDWEWAVTLFSSDPLAIKQCVHELRFDPASSVYAEFGSFTIGLLAPIDEVLRRVGLA